MRLRIFEAAGLPEAMDMVRRTLGPDAVILSSQPRDHGSGVRVTAALEETPIEEFDSADGIDALAAVDDVGQALAFHRVPAVLADRLVAAAAAPPVAGAEAALGGALEAVLRFAAQPAAEAPKIMPGRPVMLVGPPGAGKTVTAAKLCALARLEGRAASVITMDTVKAGGLAQITSFAETLGTEIYEAGDEEAVARAALACPKDRLVVVDTVGANPFDGEERAALARTARAIGTDLTLVLPGGGDAAESAEIAQSFAEAGARFLVATRLDATRRLGGLLTAAHAGNLALLAGGISPRIGGGLVALTPVALARLLLSRTDALDGLAVNSLTEPKTGTAG